MAANDTQVILNAELKIDESKLRQSLARIEQNIKFGNAFSGLTKDTSSFNYQLERATQRVITLGTAFGVLATANRIFRDIIKSTVDVEKAMINVNTIFKLTNESLGKLSSGLFNIARDTATSFDKVAEAAQEFSRQGLSVAETQKAVRAALLLSRDANIDVAESVRAVTAASNSFDKEALSRLQIVNRLASVDAAFAVSSKDLAEALIRTGSAAADAGVSFNQFIGLVTAAQQISQRGGPVIAGALNTIFTRINRKDTLDALDSLGVAITDVRGQALPTITVLQNFATAYDKMTGAIKNQAAELVGGVRQLNTLKATLKDLGNGSNSVFSQVQDVIARNNNEIERRNAARNQSLSAIGSQVATTGQQIGANIGQVGFGGLARSFLKPVVDNPLTQMFVEANGSADTMGGKVAEKFMQGFGNAVVFGLGPILFKIFASVSGKVLGNLLEDAKAITGLNAEEKQRAAIEADIVGLYKMGGAALQQQLATMASLTEQAAYLKGLLGGGGAGSLNISGLAGAVQGLGYRPRRAAGGYIPYGEEASAIARGVGGAPSSARPVLIPDFNFGGGQRGPIVANSSEFIVPNYAGGSAIFNREMMQSRGLPAGARPIAAGGYVPNAPGGYTPQQLGFGFSQAGELKTSALNELFANLARAENLAQASQFGPQIIEMANSLSKAGQQMVFKDLGTAFNKLTPLGYSINRSSDDRISSERRAAMDARTETYSSSGRLGTLVSRRSISTSGLSETERIRSVYRQQIVEEQQAARQDAIASQNTRIAKLQQKLSQARLADPYDPNLIGPRTPFGWSAPELYGPGLPSGWQDPRQIALANLRPIGRASLFDRTNSRIGNFMGGLRDRASTPGGSLALALGLPFLGGQVPDGQSGTSSGILRGALSSGLNAAGSGAVIGSLIGGPAGTLPGLAIGAAIGALSGAISKSTKSFEELSLEVDQRTKKLNEELTNVLETFRIKDDLKDSISSGNTERTIELRRELAQRTSSVTNPEYRGIMNSNSPDAAAKAALLGNKGIFSSILSGNLKSSMSGGEMSFGTIFRGGDSTAEADTAAAQAVTSAISSMSPKELNALRKAALSDPHRALIMVANKAKMDPSELNDMMNTGRSGSFVRNAILRGIGSAKDYVYASPAMAAAQNAGAARERDLLQVATGYRTEAGFIGISSSADRSIESVRQQIALANPELTDYGRLSMQGTHGAANIHEQTSAQRRQDILHGKADLIKILGDTASDQSAVENVKNATSLTELKLIRDQRLTSAGRDQSKILETKGSPFMKTLEELIKKIEELNLSETESIRANDEGNRLMRERLQRSRTFAGASEEDVGRFGQAELEYQGSVDRNDSPSVQRARQLEYESARMDGLRRAGLYTQQVADSAILRGRSNVDFYNQKDAFAASRGLGTDFRVRDTVRRGDLDYNQRLQAFQDSEAKGSPRRVFESNRENSLSFSQRLQAFQDSQNRGSPRRVADFENNENLSLDEQLQLLKDRTNRGSRRVGSLFTQNAIDFENSRLTAADAAKEARLSRSSEDTIRQRDIESFALEAQKRRRDDPTYSEGQSRLDIARNAAKLTREGKFSTGSQISSADFGVAQEQGLQGNSRGSLTGGFQSVFAGIKRDLADFSSIGQQVAQSLESNLGNAFGNFVTGAESAKNAFRSFAVSVLGDASRMLASKAISSLIASIPGFAGAANGGPIGMAAGGTVPAMLMGGEYYVGPNAARRIGYDTLRRMNGMADGGLVNGGSGVKDDVPADLPPGAFIIKKAATQRIGADYLNALVGGQVQHRAGGGILETLIGALIGGGAGYLTGGKKGAIGGALLGGIGGYLRGSNSGSPIIREDGTLGSASSAPLSMGAKLALGLGAAGGLGLLAAGMQGSGPGDAVSSPGAGYRGGVESAQAAAFGNRSGYPILQLGPQGQSYIAGYNSGPATRHWAEGGGVDVPMTSSSSGGTNPNVHVKIDINNNSATATSTSNGQGAFGGDFAQKLQRTVQGLVKEELVNQSRPDGFFTQRGRFLQR